MQKYTLIKDGIIVNQGQKYRGSILIEEGIIKQIFKKDLPQNIIEQSAIINAKDKIVLPGIIDSHVHFRDPGLTNKANIYTESRAAVAGGITSFMDMPNTIPPATNHKLLEQKFEIASKQSLANYSFYLGATNSNIEEIVNTNPKNICGIKVFMGASTGNMMVDRDKLELIFSKSPLLIATHCEDNGIIEQNIIKYKNIFGENPPINYHTKIRNEEACFKSTSLAIKLANKHNTRLHVLHISTGKELELFDNKLPSKNKLITAETCIHHLWFNEDDYGKFGNKIRWNPSVKTKKDNEALLKGLKNNTVDIISTDHAPHTINEKEGSYFNSMSGGPMVQHSLQAMLEFYFQDKLSLETIVEKMCHTPADIFNINKRGYLKEGYNADIIIVDPNKKTKVTKENILYKCKWSTFEGYTFGSTVSHTFINGNLVYENGKFNDKNLGKRLVFDR
ncbi:MAG: dihydroorotase [Bacteroidetes bacterium]|nr:dihydroorotase [Bacteroidota bacterium]